MDLEFEQVLIGPTSSRQTAIR